MNLYNFVKWNIDNLTFEDIYALPDGLRAELIDGKIYYMAQPSTRHQKIISDIHYVIKDYIIKNKGGCKVLPAPFAAFLNKDDKNYVEPDISIICDKDKITDKGCHGAPDWIIEIISPGNKEMDYYKKLFKYQAAGVREYWIVDPIKAIIMVYRIENLRKRKNVMVYGNYIIKRLSGIL